jgi:hypothetical protein
VGIPDAAADLTAWVRASCAAVPATTWQATGGAPTGGVGPSQQLYDCAGVAGT